MRDALLRIVAALALCGAIALFLDFDKAAAALAAIAPSTLAVCAIVLLTQTFVAALRWRYVSIASAAPLPMASSFRIFLIGQFFGQFLPTSVGGDAMRMALVRRFTRSISGAVGLVVSDRLVALVTAVLLITIISPLTVWIAVPDRTWVVGIGLLLCSFYIALAFALVFGKRILARFDRWSRLRPVVEILRNLLDIGRHPLSPAILGMSLLVHALMVVAIAAAAWGLAIPVTGMQLAAVGPWIVLCAMLPISFGNWGVREASMIIGLGLVGVGVEQALAASLTVAAGQVAVALLGMVLWLAMGAPKAGVAPDTVRQRA